MSLVAAPFLLGLVLVALPWWLHRMYERNPAEHTVSSLFLMRAASEPVRIRLRLRYLALLCVRVGMLTVAVLAFAQPVFDVARTAFGGDADLRPTKVIVLDGSMSMSREGVWDEALERADELARDGPSYLVLAGADLELLPDVRAATSGATRLNFAGLLMRIDSVIATLPVDPGGDAGFEVHLVSDFQRAAMPSQFNALVEGGTWPVVLHPMVGSEDNWAVTSLRIKASAAGEAAVVVDAAVVSFARTSRDVDVVLRRDDIEIGRARMSLSPGSRRTVSFELAPIRRGDAAVEIAIVPNDALAHDDVRRAVQSRRERVPLPVIAPGVVPAIAPGKATGNDPLSYLTAAIEASSVPLDAQRIDSAAAWPAGATVAVIIDPGNLGAPSTSSLLRRVERHLSEGGGALLVVGPRTAAAGVVPIVDRALERVAIEAGPRARHVVIEDRGHPALGGADGWQDVEVMRSLSLTDPPTGDTILSLDDGRALLIEQRLGKGRLLILLTALDREWNSLLVRPVFVAFVADALAYLAQDLTMISAIAGEPISIPASSVQLFDRNGDRVLDLGHTINRPVVRLPDPGFYSVRTPGQRGLMAVNTDLRESDLQPMAADALMRWQAATTRRAGAVQSVAPAGESEAAAAKWPLAPWLLGLLALLVLAEPLVANLGRAHARLSLGQEAAKEAMA